MDKTTNSPNDSTSLKNDDSFLDKSSIPIEKFEFLDHTADIQLHSWGDSLKEAFEQIAICMYSLLTTDINTVEMKVIHEVDIKEDDMMNLLFHYLDELLFLFSADPFLIGRKIQITEFDQTNFAIKARIYGEPFDVKKHPQGCDIKAITFSNMQIHEDTNKLYVIVDI